MDYSGGYKLLALKIGILNLDRPLIIHSRDEKRLQSIAYDTDRVVMLQDYYHELSSGLLLSSLSPGNEADPIPDGALINGKC